MQPDPVRRCQLEFAAAMVAAEIGDDDPEAQAAYDAAFAVLCATKPLSLDEAAEHLSTCLDGAPARNAAAGTRPAAAL